jgi:hypothetical protein
MLAAFREAAVFWAARARSGATGGTRAEDAFIAKLEGSGGTSIGGVLALMVVVRAPYALIKSLTCDYDAEGAHVERMWGSFAEYIDVTRILMRGESILTDAFIYDKLDYAMTRLGLPCDITFAQLHARTNGRHFEVNAMSDTDQSVLYMNHETTPNMPVRLGLRMTMSLPGLLAPVRWGDRTYVDGGLACNYAIHRYPQGQAMGVMPDLDGSRVAAGFGSGVAASIHTLRTILPVVGILINVLETMYVSSIHTNVAYMAALSPDQRQSTFIVTTPECSGFVLTLTAEDIDQLWADGAMSARLRLEPRKLVGQVAVRMSELYGARSEGDTRRGPTATVEPPLPPRFQSRPH